jgi:acetyl esterase
MPFHPQVQELWNRAEADGTPPLYTLSLEQAREADLEAVAAGSGPPEPVGRVEELVIPGPGGDLPGRLYTSAGGGIRPVVIYFFGGGWTLGTLDTCDAVCRSLTNGVGCATVSVGYRLAPEHKFPAAVEDCYNGTAWVAANADRLGVDASRLAVAGDSAGGNLAAAVTLLARERGGPPIAHQLLVYPNTDYRADTPSMREMTDEHFFNRKSVSWYWGHYLTSAADGDNPLVSPLRARDLGGLPPATVITAEYDPLRDEGERYAARLAEAGVPTQARRFDGMVHGFFTMIGTLDGAREAMAYAVERLSGALADRAGH